MPTADSFPLASRATAGHYAWGEGCHAWFLLRSATVHVIEESMPPGAGEVEHYHRQATQFFYVLHGELSMRDGTAVTRIPAGHGITVAPGRPHQATNASTNDVRFLVISCPPSHGDRVDSAEGDRV
jgi:mannose-6-phosphate isomerase-like protein (cupin superfamily)